MIEEWTQFSSETFFEECHLVQGDFFCLKRTIQPSEWLDSDKESVSVGSCFEYATKDSFTQLNQLFLAHNECFLIEQILLESSNYSI